MVSTDNTASIALLRRVRAGDRVHFVHHVDVCDAVPEVLVADLEPVPGTGVEDDGYSSVWYCYCAKKFTNTRGKLTGHRHRKVTGGCGTSWHSETSGKEVQGSGGGTFCTLSYSRKTEPSARSIDRLGWCMVEYDFVAADDKRDEAADDSSHYVLCKVYRSPRAKGKPASSSSSSKNAASKQTAKKRKAAGGDHPEAPPAKSFQQQEEQKRKDAGGDHPEAPPSKSFQQQEEQKRKAAGGDHPEAPPAKSFQQQEEQVFQQQEEQVQQDTAWYQPQGEGGDLDFDFTWYQPQGMGGDLDFDFNIEDIDFYLDETCYETSLPLL